MLKYEAKVLLGVKVYGHLSFPSLNLNPVKFQVICSEFRIFLSYCFQK